MGVRSDIIAVGAGAAYDLIPAAGEDYLVTEIGSSVWVGVAPAGVPQVNAGLYDGTLGPANFRTATDIRGWNNAPQWYISRSNYLRLGNPGGAGENISISVKTAQEQGPNGSSMVISDLLAVGAGAAMTVQPAAGQDWCITDIGSTRWVGGAPAGLPNVTVAITDGVSFATIATGADARGWFKPLEIYINNSVYLLLTNPVGAGATLGFSGFIARDYGPNGASMVASMVGTVGIGGVLTVQPPAGEEWKITEIGASAWLGVPPASLPDVTVSMTDGTLASILARNTDDKGWMGDIEIYIDHNNYLTLTDTSGAGGDLGVSAAKVLM